jgi:hypothetical protein
MNLRDVNKVFQATRLKITANGYIHFILLLFTYRELHTYYTILYTTVLYEQEWVQISKGVWMSLLIHVLGNHQQ